MKQRKAKSSAGREDVAADEPSTSYRPMGAALTLEEVSVAACAECSSPRAGLRQWRLSALGTVRGAD